MSVLDILKRRKEERAVSANQFVREAVQAEVRGDGDTIDAGRLEAMLEAVGKTPEQFAAEVERQQEISRLREIVAGKQAASKDFHAAAEHARTVRAEHQERIRELQQGIAEAEQAETSARSAVDSIQQAEQQLRQYVSDSDREARTEVKQVRSQLGCRRKELESQLAEARRMIDRVDSKKFSTRVAREKYLNSQQQTVERCITDLASVEQQISELDSALERSEAEAIGAG